MSGIKPRPISILTLLSLCIAIVFCVEINYAFAAKKLTVGVIYPQTREPYRSVLRTIISGIKKSSKNPVKLYELNKKSDPDRINHWAEKHKVQVVIALGKQGLIASKALPVETKRLIGAVLAPPNSEYNYVTGIALAPAPDSLFRRLRKFSPEIKEITVVYHKPSKGWLIEIAKKEAQLMGIKLNALEAPDLREAANLYRVLMENIDNNHAVWLLQDNYTVDQRTILPMLLKASWRKRFVVFSSNPAHVQRGVLFSLYPDNFSMGKRLGKLASDLLESPAIKDLPIQPLTDLQIAVNVRTADHLKLNVSNEDKSSFDLTFPPMN